MLLKYSLLCVRPKLFLSRSLRFLFMGEEYVDPQEHFLPIHFSLSSDLQVWSWLFTTPRLPIDFKEQDSVGAVWKSPNKGFQEEAAEFITTEIYIDLEDDRFAMASTMSSVNWSGTTKRRRTMQSSPSVCSDNPSFLLLSVLTVCPACSRADPPLPAPGWQVHYISRTLSVAHKELPRMQIHCHFVPPAPKWQWKHQSLRQTGLLLFPPWRICHKRFANPQLKLETSHVRCCVQKACVTFRAGQRLGQL